jgi:hypothetical protein
MLYALLLCALADPDPNYHALHEGVPSEALRTENVELRRDKASVRLINGQLAFIKAAQERSVIAVFTGEGVFHLTPAIAMEATYLTKVTGKPEVEETFDSAVFFFTDSTYDEVKKQASAMPVDPKAAQLLKTLREKVHIEGEMLAEILNPQRGQSFRGYFHGKKNNDLRFLMIPSGAMPEIQASEEVALLNVDSANGGIWYLSHLETEWAKGMVKSNEDKRDVLPRTTR